jgi:hypothetical protein
MSAIDRLACAAFAALVSGACGGAALASGPPEHVELIGEAVIPGNTKDLSGLEWSVAAAGGTITAGTLGSMGGAIDWMGPGAGNRYIMVNDRGPLDGAVDFACRWHILEFALPADATRGAAVQGGVKRASVPWKLLSTTMLTRRMDGGTREGLTGLSSRFDRRTPERSRRLDPEGVRVLPGTGGSKPEDLRVLVSDEYGPSVRLFDGAGVQVKPLPIPSAFGVLRADASADAEDAMNGVGRLANRGFEGLALSADGQTAWAVTQSPLLQDGGKQGRHVRMVRLNVATGASVQVVYPLRDSNYVLSEGLWLDEHRLLTIERDGHAGARAGFKSIMLADLRDASDVSGRAALPKRSLGPDVRPAQTRILIDLLDDRFGLAGPDFPEKIEGLSWGPTLSDGRRVLVVASDNDLVAERATRVWFFAVPMKEFGRE